MLPDRRFMNNSSTINCNLKRIRGGPVLQPFRLLSVRYAVGSARLRSRNRKVIPFKG